MLLSKTLTSAFHSQLCAVINEHLPVLKCDLTVFEGSNMLLWLYVPDVKGTLPTSLLVETESRAVCK